MKRFLITFCFLLIHLVSIAVIAAALGADRDKFAIQVSEWQTFSFEQQDPEKGAIGSSKEEKAYCFHSSIQKDDTVDDNDVGDGIPETIDAVKPPSWKPSLLRSKSNASSGETSTTPKPKLFRAVSNASSTGEGKGHHRTMSRGHRRNTSTAGSIIHAVEDPVLSGLDLWETDEGCHDLARAGYYQTPKCDGTVQIEEGCTGGVDVNGRGKHPRANSSFRFNDVGIDVSEGGNRSRANSSIRFTDVEEELSGSGSEEGVVVEGEDNSRSLPRPRRIHQRSVTFDASQLAVNAHNDPLRDLETDKIRERLHGYVRP
jgi:hypothetical protein